MLIVQNLDGNVDIEVASKDIYRVVVIILLLCKNRISYWHSFVRKCKRLCCYHLTNEHFYTTKKSFTENRII